MESTSKRSRPQPQKIVPKPALHSKIQRPSFPSHSPIMVYSNALYYIPGGKPPSSLLAEALSHIYYAFAKTSGDGHILYSDEDADAHKEVDGCKGYIRACVALKRKNNHLKILLSIGGGGDEASKSLARIASNEQARLTFAESARTLVDQFGMDGIDIYWDSPPGERLNIDYIWLLSELRKALPASRYVITTALPGCAVTLASLNLRYVSNYVDHMNIKCYDFSGEFSTASWHHSQLYEPAREYSPTGTTTCVSILELVLGKQKVPKSKVLLGIPLYGRSFEGAEGFGQPFHSTRTIPYRDLPRPGTFEDFDNHTKAVYCSGGDGGFVTYDNPTTVKLKADIVKSNQLGGLFFFEAAGDLEGSRSLVLAGSECLAP